MESELKKAFTKEDAYKNLERVNGWIANCDTKTAILFGVLGVIIGLTSEVFKVFGFLKNICAGSVEATSGNITLLVFQMISIIAYLISTILSFFNLINIVKARIEPKIYKNVEKSILHFWSIQNKTCVNFIEDCQKIDEEQLIKDINKQVWINSKICNTKFYFYKKAIIYIIITSVLAIFTLILVKLI